MILSVTSQATNPPISLADAKSQLRMYATYDDTLITSLLYAAWAKCEQLCQKTFCTRTYTLTLDAFPLYNADQYFGAPMTGLQLWFTQKAYWPLFNQTITLPKPPVQSVTSIVYLDPTTGNPVTLTSSDFLFVGPQPARVSPLYGSAWPVARFQPGSVQVTYVAGYCDPGSNPDPTTSLIPWAVQQAIRLAVVHLYEHRGEDSVELPQAVKDLLLTEYIGESF